MSVDQWDSGEEWEFESLVKLDYYLVQTRAFSFYQTVTKFSVLFFSFLRPTVGLF